MIICEINSHVPSVVGGSRDIVFLVDLRLRDCSLEFQCFLNSQCVRPFFFMLLRGVL